MVPFQCSGIDINTSSPSELKKTFTKVDYDQLPPLLRNIDTEDILSCSDINQAYSKLEKGVSEAVQSCTSTFIPKSNSDNPWFDAELKKLRIKKQRYHNILRRNRNVNNKVKYDAISKEYDKLIFEKKKQFNHKRLDKYKTNLKKKWLVINELLGRKKKENSFHSIYVDGVLVKDNQTLANAFNSFFAQIPKEYHDKLPKMDECKRIKDCNDYLKNKKDSKYLPKKFIDSIFLKPTSEDEISKR